MFIQTYSVRKTKEAGHGAGLCARDSRVSSISLLKILGESMVDGSDTCG